MGDPIEVRPSIVALWQRAAADLRALGAEVVEIDFTPMHEYEADRPGQQTVTERGLMPENWWFQRGRRPGYNSEMNDLAPWAYEQFLRSCQDPARPSWSAVDADQVFPDPDGSVEARGKGLPHGYREVKARIAAGLTPPEQIENFTAALRGVENLRKVLFEDWMKREKLDAIVFPANADVGRANSDMDEISYMDANRNGVFFSNMNHMIRHLGIPSVSVTMGVMEDTRMPVNLTFAGPAYSDNDLLAYAFAYEQGSRRRVAAPRAPALPGETIEWRSDSVVSPARRKEHRGPSIDLEVQPAGSAGLAVRGTATDDSGIAVINVYMGGQRILSTTDGKWAKTVQLDQPASGASAARSVRVMVVARDRLGNASARLQDINLP
jgi:amidase